MMIMIFHHCLWLLDKWPTTSGRLSAARKSLPRRCKMESEREALFSFSFIPFYLASRPADRLVGHFHLPAPACVVFRRPAQQQATSAFSENVKEEQAERQVAGFGYLEFKRVQVIVVAVVVVVLLTTIVHYSISLVSAETLLLFTCLLLHLIRHYSRRPGRIRINQILPGRLMATSWIQISSLLSNISRAGANLLRCRLQAALTLANLIHLQYNNKSSSSSSFPSPSPSSFPSLSPSERPLEQNERERRDRRLAQPNKQQVAG